MGLLGMNREPGISQAPPQQGDGKELPDLGFSPLKHFRVEVDECCRAEHLFPPYTPLLYQSPPR